MDFSFGKLFQRGEAGSEQFSVVEHQLTGNLNASLGIRDRLTVSIGLPLVFLQNGEDIPANLGDALDMLEEDTALHEVMGVEFIKVYDSVKRNEYKEFLQVISPWEREHLLLNV